MRSGQLRHRIVIQEPVSSTGYGFGASRKEDWEEFKTVWGAVWPLRGTELLTAQQLKSEITSRVRIRYTDGVTSGKRLKLGDSTTYYDIISVINPDMRNIYLDLMIREQI